MQQACSISQGKDPSRSPSIPLAWAKHATETQQLLQPPGLFGEF